MENNIEEKIKKAAKSIFLKQGYKETKMATIAEEVGLTRPAMHYYFRTKERLFRAVFGDIIMSFVPKIKSSIVKEVPLEQKVSEVVDIYLKVLEESPELPLFLLREVNRDLNSLIEMAVDNNVAELGTSLMQVITKEMDEGRMKKLPLIQVAYTFYGLMMSPFLAHPLGKHIFNTDSLSPEFLEIWKKHIVNQNGVFIGSRS